MKYKLSLITATCVAALAFGGSLNAADAKKPTPTPSPAPSGTPTPKNVTATSAEKAPRPIPFRGTASAVDQSTKSFTIAGKTTSRVFMVTDKTTVTKDGSPATLADLADNDAVTGSYWKQDDGTLEAKSLKIGGKTEAEKAASGSKSKKASDDATASPSPSPKK